jgi:membrane-associated phospholipid phosphatase
MKLQWFIAVFVMAPIIGWSQKADTLINKLDSLSKKTDKAGGQINNTNEHAYDSITQITFKSYFFLLGSDFKQAITKPFHMTGKDWGNVGKFAVVAGALAFADESIQRSALKMRNDNVGLQKTSKFITNFGGTYEVAVLGGLGVYGFAFKNQKMKTTTLLATQSYIISGALAGAIKFLAGRQRPYFDDSTEVQAKPIFYGPLYNPPRDVAGKKTHSSFPSGHTTAAFAAATVYAMEYRDKPWVPILAYSTATLIGLSRLTENKHWATDVLTGAALGYLSGRLIVNNYHRYAKLKAPSKKSNKAITFNLQYSEGYIEPGLTYSF